MKRFLALVMILVMTVCCFASCGQKTEGNKDKGVVTIGYTIYEPQNYMENGELVGFDTELAKAVFKNLGYEEKNIVFKEIKWDNKYTDLNTDTIDCIWNGFTANVPDDDGTQRKDKVDFSYNYMLNQQAIVVKADKLDTYTNAETSFKDKIGYVEAGSAGETYATETLTGAKVMTAIKQTDAIFEVKAGSADFAVVDILLAKSYCGKGDYADLAIVTAIEADAEYYAIGFKKGSELTAQVNAELVKLAADGTIAKLGEKYGVSNSIITDFSDQQ